ncbi:MAG: hypothetical protein KAI29_03050, partial [Cyclobacteriaceae bacterium]|nr:hypothetical protein [Cyclobacteriaceae bacterium]
MKKSKITIFILFTFILLFTSCQNEKVEKNFSFIAACDMRYFVLEEYRSSEWTLGGFQAIEKVGKGEFMISPGDVEPPWATRELMD